MRALATDSDVYAFAYSQNGTVEDVAASETLGAGIAKLRAMQYLEVVVVGHSAGGVIAREFVEDHPDAGVAMVIQVCAPNAGAALGSLACGVRKNQEAFVQSLSKAERQRPPWRSSQPGGGKAPNLGEFLDSPHGSSGVSRPPG